jgi:WD40-like Beta Propeller Repeat
MRRLNGVRALVLWFGLWLGAASATIQAARTVQDGVVQDGVPAISAQIAAGLQRYRSGSEARLLDWSADGELLIAAREGGQEQLLRVRAEPSQRLPIAAPAGALRMATSQPFRNDWIAYLGDEAGPGGAALSLAPVHGGEVQLLVSGAARPGTPAWAHDGRQLAFSATLRDGQNVDLYVLDTAGQAGPRLLATGGANAWQVLAWTSTDRALLVHHTISGAGDELLLVDARSGDLHRVDAPGERAPGYGHIGETRLAPDGRGIYFIGDRNSELARLHFVDFYAASTQVLLPDLGHDLEHFDVSADNRSIAYSWIENGYSRVALLDRRAAVSHTLADLPAGVVAALRFDHTGARLAIDLAASAAPRDVYVHDLATAATNRWTDSLLGGFGAAQVVAPQTVRFPTWDRSNGRTRTLTALLYRPRSSGPYPVLVLLDAPGARLRPQLDPYVQYCVNELGFAVLAPGLRDGEAGMLDLGALLAWLGVQSDLRRDRVALQGRGSGGTLALTGLGLYGDRLRGAISIDGSASSAQLSPVRQPVLLVRGLLRPALDAASAEQLLWRLRSANVESWFVAPRERAELLTGEPEQAAAQRVIAQFLANLLSR